MSHSAARELLERERADLLKKIEAAAGAGNTARRHAFVHELVELERTIATIRTATALERSATALEKLTAWSTDGDGIVVRSL